MGNSWTLGHGVYDFFQQRVPGDAYTDWPVYFEKRGRFTITVERTEVLDGKTYYVLSDMPSGDWPPAPPHFLAGKKLRWEGAHLMERTDTGEQSLYRFDDPASYTIPTMEGDNEVIRMGSPPNDTYPVQQLTFHFYGYDGYGEWPAGEGEPWRAGRYVGFLAGYGLAHCLEYIDASDFGVFANEIHPLSATLVEPPGAGGAGGASGTTRTVSYEDALRGRTATSTSSSSWGEIKQPR